MFSMLKFTKGGPSVFWAFLPTCAIKTKSPIGTAHIVAADFNLSADKGRSAVNDPKFFYESHRDGAYNRLHAPCLRHSKSCIAH
jgi:hypothetical protein